MKELWTIDDLELFLRDEVMRAGGAKKWCKKHNIHMSHAMHMIENGTAASIDRVTEALGYRKVTRYEAVDSK